MKLLDAGSFHLIEFGELPIPRYSILSHTWSAGEVLFHDIQSIREEAPSTSLRAKLGWRKFSRFCAISLDFGFNFVWLDTCCIDKADGAELNEAIASMYKTYREANLCCVYLEDVDTSSLLSMEEQFRRARWFTRGWTVIELIGPPNVVFFDRKWTMIGQKTDPVMREWIHGITGIAIDVLANTRVPTQASIAETMSWLDQRNTTRIEDMSYCIQGMLGLRISIAYGEGDAAMSRFWEAVCQNREDYTMLLWTWPKNGRKYAQWPSISIFPSGIHYRSANPTCPDWTTLQRHSPAALPGKLIRHLPPFDKAPEGPRITARGLTFSLFAKNVRGNLVAWAYCTQTKRRDGKDIDYAVCVHIEPAHPLDATQRYLRGVLLGEVYYITLDRLRGFSLYDVTLCAESTQPHREREQRIFEQGKIEMSQT